MEEAETNRATQKSDTYYYSAIIQDSIVLVLLIIIALPNCITIIIVTMPKKL